MDDLVETSLRAALIAGTTEGPVKTALAMSRLGPPALDDLGELANDRRLSPLQRATVLLALSIVLANHPDKKLPPSALDAIENSETALAAIRSGLGAALTSVLDAAGADPSIGSTRRLLARQLVAAGEGGPHVVELLISIGDLDRACELAAADLARHLGDTAVPTSETWARLLLLLEPRAQAVLAGVIDRLPRSQLAVLDRLLTAVPGADPQSVARARSAIVWALAP